MELKNRFVRWLLGSADEPKRPLLEIPKSESLRLVVPGALDFSLVFIGDRQEVMDEVFKHMEQLLEFMSERSEILSDTMKTSNLVEKKYDIAIA